MSLPIMIMTNKKFTFLFIIILFVFSCQKETRHGGVLVTRQAGTVVDDGDLLRPAEGYLKVKRSSYYSDSTNKSSRAININNGCKLVTGLVVNRISYATISISWIAQRKSVYKIYRSTDGVQFDYITTTANTYYDDSGLLSLTKYWYKVSAVNINTLSECFSTYVTATTIAAPIKSNTKVLFLDFDGAIISNTSWNWNGDIVVGPANLTAAQIVFIVDSVSKAYKIIDTSIIVTTDEVVYNSANPFKRQWTVLTESWQWYCGSTICAGGVSYINSFSSGDNTPNFVFTSALNYNQSYITRADIHEDGHGFGLYHDVDSCAQSYSQNGNWMGASYGKPGYFSQHSLSSASCVYVDQPAIIRSKL